ncbi:FAD-dependent tricarballylate dehydrogenase TcuA [Rhabdochromatium marinum]|uniref:FAD-dependent tricarballylate dehydrogenase TcuA n=1 Tax=Rhabdochromatium marinum TaxID=48729 RepID=UPI001902ED5A|nr:tricarballylate dehydrogenase [Rhabdochromatium marinum]
MNPPEVLVIGGGIAGLCAAIRARRSGAQVMLAESAPPWQRGGNSRHARNFRFCHEQPSPLAAGTYGATEFAQDLARVTGGSGDATLARVLIERSRALPDWLHGAGVALQTRNNGRLPFSRKTAFLLGGGQAMVNALYQHAEQLGVDIRYQCTLSQPRLLGNRLSSLRLQQGEQCQTLQPVAVVLACGGAQGNPDWLRQHCGAGVVNFINRGTPEARGEPLLELLAHGMQGIGDPSRLYLVAVDARSPPTDGGIVTRIRGMPQGLVVDRNGQRRHDEGADSGSTRYALWGQRLASYPDQIGYLLLDAAGLNNAPAALYPPICADHPRALAQQLGIDPAALEQTLQTYNAAMHQFQLQRAPQTASSTPVTTGLQPPRTGPAHPLKRPPFAAYPLRPGLTFTYHGLAVDTQARTRLTCGEPMLNLFAAGTLMAPNLCPQGYLSGLMLTIGMVFGSLAGEEAARYARSR